MTLKLRGAMRFPGDGSNKEATHDIDLGVLSIRKLEVSREGSYLVNTAVFGRRRVRLNREIRCVRSP